MAAGGAGLGAWIGHVARGIDRDDLKEIGETLEEGSSALIVVGVDKDAERVQKAAEKAAKSTTKRVEGDYEEAEHEAVTMMGTYDKAA